MTNTLLSRRVPFQLNNEGVMRNPDCVVKSSVSLPELRQSAPPRELFRNQAQQNRRQARARLKKLRTRHQASMRRSSNAPNLGPWAPGEDNEHLDAPSDMEGRSRTRR
eukprot:SAG31_NODE_24528_length_479_cov_1.334211_1_plen_107_part_01